MTEHDTTSVRPTWYRLAIAGLAGLILLGGGFLLGRRLERAATARAFEGIYAQKVWGKNAEGKGHSGPGSSLRATVVYRAYLQDFLERHRIRSVVDAGCGDWQFSSAVDWRGIDYKGYDIVGALIEGNRRRYGAANIRFFVGDIVKTQLPPADLLLCKNVLQHLTNSQVRAFLAQLSKYEHVLLTNGVDPKNLSGANGDIPVGGYRNLDLTRPPFSLPAMKVLTYHDGSHTQQVLYLRRRER